MEIQYRVHKLSPIIFIMSWIHPSCHSLSYFFKIFYIIALNNLVLNVKDRIRREGNIFKCLGITINSDEKIDQ